ncbi:hypothetical protein Pelo_2200 [Pelomyxa schiedti]|nr:hypothetical protein Pelo_2200 [Pelomyxa schiedti]
MKCQLLSLALLFVAVSCADMPDCTYDDYMSWNIVNNNRYMTVYPHDSLITVTVGEYGLDSLEFTEAFDNTMCNYWSSNHNGWTLTTSGTNGCVRTVTKDFDADDYNTHCASSSDTMSGYQITTVVQEDTEELYTGTSLDGTIETVVVNGVFNDVMLLPTSASYEITIETYDPGKYSALVSGYCGVMYDTDYCDIKVQTYAPYYVYSINPVPVSFPTTYVDDAVVLTREVDPVLHEISTVTGTVTMYPKADCKVYGNVTIRFLVDCLDEDSTCDAGTLADFPYFDATFTIGIPDCSVTTHEAEAFLTMRTYNKDGQVDATFKTGTTITIEEIITTTGGTPGEDCDCVTDMFIYDWSGNLLGSYIDMESLAIFDTESLVVTPLENEFSAYLDPSIFPDPNGEVVQLAATCTINWGFKKETVSFGRKFKILRDAPGSAEGTAELTVGVDTNSDDDNDNTTWIILGVIGGVAVAGVAGGFIAYFAVKKIRNPSGTPQEKQHLDY